MTAKPNVKGIRHVGLHALNPETLATFYRKVLGLQITDQGGLTPDGIRRSVFLCSQSHEGEHQLAIYADPDIHYAAFEVHSLADLRAFYQRVVDLDLPIRWVLNHGVALAFYFVDPAGNLIKLYWPTGVAYPQPHGHPIDLTQPEADLRQDVADLVAQLNQLEGGT
jgi:catechol-2,3-dioxygenase